MWMIEGEILRLYDRQKEAVNVSYSNSKVHNQHLSMPYSFTLAAGKDSDLLFMPKHWVKNQ